MQPPERFTLDARGLGQRIAALRRAHGWSQRRLAEAAGVSHGYIALLELGRLPSPGKPRLDAIARALDLPSSDALAVQEPPSLPAGWTVPYGAVFESGQRTASRPVEADGGPAGQAHGQAAGLRSGQTARVPSGQTAGIRAGEAAGIASASAVTAQSIPASASARQASAHAGVPRSVAPPQTSAGGQASDALERLNVVGSLEQLRGVGARPLPIFRWGACGDPRDLDSPPDPDRLEYPPPGRETLIGPHGFGVVVKGDSMAGRGIFDGDVVWVNPERSYGVGKVVLALVSDGDGEPAGMVVKTYARTEVGDCLLSEADGSSRTPVVCREFKVIGPVVGITSWRLPS
jgi:transcriptional regulator with XRE-family HTH domain/SOS-response transcriptional repressor LexA